GLSDRLPLFFGEWERWEVEVLDSHVAYPLLGYFRSSHDNLSWISALGTVLDTATLVLTTIEDVPRGQAELARELGIHLVEDITNLGNRAPAMATVDRAAFDAVYARLGAAGYRPDPETGAWAAVSAAPACVPPVAASSRRPRGGRRAPPPAPPTPTGSRRWLRSGSRRRCRGSAG